MGKTSNTVKDRWNRQNYDSLLVRLPKGRKADIEAHAQSKGVSVNGLVGELLRADMGMSEDDWKHKPDEDKKTTALDRQSEEC